ncbi:alcohol dehydrogenase, partial [Phialemonium atrogriseum]
MAPSMPTRKLGKTDIEIPVIGLGAMGLSIAYGFGGTDAERLALLDRAWELSCTHWDTSDVYGDNEDLLSRWFELHPERRRDIVLATKCGLTLTPRGDGGFDMSVDSSPEYVMKACERSLARLGVDYIDLYYIHRLDGKTPVEKTMGALAELKKQGKIRAIGISGASATSLRRAHAVAAVDAAQVEYSPWELAVERGGVLATCRELGVTVVCYSPLGRGFLTGALTSRDDLAEGDFRSGLPRFEEGNFGRNLGFVERLREKAAGKGCTPAQLCLAWLVAQGGDVVVIPGTKRVGYLEENVGAAEVVLSEEEVREIRAEVDAADVVGEPYMEGALPEYEDTPELS